MSREEENCSDTNTKICAAAVGQKVLLAYSLLSPSHRRPRLSHSLTNLDTYNCYIPNLIPASDILHCNHCIYQHPILHLT